MIISPKRALLLKLILKPCQIELWDFVDALAKARPVEIDATEGLKSKAVSEAGLRIREIRTGRQSG